MKIPNPEDQPVMKVWPETGAVLDLSKSATYAGIKSGAIPSIRVGGRILVPTAALRRMLQLDGGEAA